MSELLAKVMEEKRLNEHGGIVMKSYYIEVNYTPSGLCAMERDLLDQAKPFNNSLIVDAQVDDLVAYFESVQQAFHKAKPKLKTVDISHWETGTSLQYIHIGQICLTLKEVRNMPIAFYNYIINKYNKQYGTERLSEQGNVHLHG